MNNGYENRRENLWKAHGGEAATGKHYSYFLPSSGDNPIGGEAKRKIPEYTIKIEVDRILTLVENKLRYKKKWLPHDVYNFGVLWEYLQQCVDGGYQMCIISKQEFAMIQKGG